ncbi:hypothetical protein D1872_304710 [compost metagenome]
MLSICCATIMMTNDHSAVMGESMKATITIGIVDRIGPKYGMKLKIAEMSVIRSG